MQNHIENCENNTVYCVNENRLGLESWIILDKNGYDIF